MQIRILELRPYFSFMDVPKKPTMLGGKLNEMQAGLKYEGKVIV